MAASSGLFDDDDWEPDPELLKKLSEKYKGEQIPLFMDELPPDWETNPHYAAIRCLLYDEQTPEERVRGFRNQGNELYADALRRDRNARWRRQNLCDAIKCYSQAISENSSPPETQSILYSNRAMARLSLGDYIDCVDDCREALRLDPSAVKAYYRAARASSLMELWRQAEHFASEGLKRAPEDEHLKKLHNEIRSRVQALSARQQEEQRARRVAADAANQTKQDRLEHAYALRKLTVTRESQYDLSALRLEERLRYDSTADVLHWPCLVLYPEHDVSESILDFADDTCVADHLAVMFADYAPWDSEKTYEPGNLQVFLEGRDNALTEICLNVPLREVLTSVGYIARLPVLHVVVRGSAFAEKFIKDSDIKDSDFSCS